MPETEKNIKPQRRFTDEEIAQIRTERNTPHPENSDRPMYTHSQLAEKWGVSGQRISGIVRGNLNPDKSYKPVFDGHRNRPRDADGKVIKKEKEAPAPEAASVSDTGTYIVPDAVESDTGASQESDEA